MVNCTDLHCVLSLNIACYENSPMPLCEFVGARQLSVTLNYTQPEEQHLCPLSCKIINLLVLIRVLMCKQSLMLIQSEKYHYFLVCLKLFKIMKQQVENVEERAAC